MGWVTLYHTILYIRYIDYTILYHTGLYHTAHRLYHTIPYRAVPYGT